MSELSSRVNTTKSYLPWVMWGLGALFYCYETLLQVSPSVMVSDLMKAFSVTGGQLGLLAGIYFWAYASMQIPVGMLLDRLGPRRLLTIATFVCASGALLFGSAQVLPVAAFGRLLIGLGSAFAAVGCMHLCATWLPLRHFATLTGIMVTMGMLGAIGGEGPLSLMVSHMGWRQTLFVFGALGLALACLIWIFVRDKGLTQTSSTEATQKTGLLAGIKHVVKSKQNVIIAIYGALMFAPTTVFGGLWGVPFLMTAYHYTRPVAATIVSMLFIGWVFGAPLFGIFSDRIGRRKVPLVIGSLGTLITFSIVLFVPALKTYVLSALLFCVGFFSGGFLPSFSIIRESNPHHINATSIGFMNAFNMLTGAILQPLVGWICDLTWHGAVNNGIREYSVASFHKGLILLPLGLLISVMLLPFIKETYCRAEVDVRR